MILTVVENVRGYLGSRPPLVVFMIFLGSMAVGLITFAYFVSDMPRTVVDQEFKMWTEHLSALKFCVGEEQGGLVLSNASQSQNPMVGGAGKMSYVERMKRSDTLWMREEGRSQMVPMMTFPPPSSAAMGSSVVNESLMVSVEIAATASLRKVLAHHNTTTVTTTLWASQLGRAGRGQDVEANVTMVLSALSNHSRPCLQGLPGQCYRFSACVTMTAPQHFFPRTLHPDALKVCRRDPELGGENHLYGETVLMGSERCANTSVLHLQQVLSSAHHELITMDRSATNLHLMHSSYFLFVMVISLFCYAMIKGRAIKVKVMHTQCASDKHSLIQV